MAMIKRDQLQYSGRGPLDSKALVKEYAMLLDASTWTTTVDNTEMFTAYNGMIVAVWLNKTDTSKNGLYFLYDPQVTSPVKKPDVTNEANWHRIDNQSGSVDLSQIEARLNTFEIELGEVKNDVSDLSETKSETFAKYELFPKTGIVNKIYIALDEQKSYVWEASAGYVCITGEIPEITTIVGGNAFDE